MLPLVPARLKKAFLLAVPALAFGFVLVMFTMARGEFWHVPFLQWTLVFGRVDSLSLVFAVIMSGMCCIGTLYGLHVEEDAQHIAAWTYVAGSLGAIFAGDLLTLFLFWEMMAFSSVFLIWFRRTPGVHRRRLPLPAGARRGRPGAAGRHRPAREGHRQHGVHRLRRPPHHAWPATSS